MKALTTQGNPAGAPADALLATLSDHVRRVVSDINTDEAYADLRSDVRAFDGRCDEEVAHQVVVLCLGLLRRLREELASAAERFAREERVAGRSKPAAGEHHAPKLPPDVLSFDQNATVTAVLQFVLALAVLPCLVPPGLGGAEERTRHGAGLLKAAATRPCPRLFRVAVDGLLDVALHATLGGLLLSRYLADLLAAVIQLVKDRRAVERAPVGCSSALCSRSGGGGGEEVGCSSTAPEGSDAERSHYRVRMNALLKSVYKPLLVREILVLLHRARVMTSPRPDWLERTCGELLTGVLRGHDGVRSVVSGMLLDGDQSWQQCDAAGLVIATCPSSSKPDDYYKLIAPQVMSLLTSDDPVAAELYRKVACSIINAMAVRHLPEMKAHVWSLLAGPLVAYVEAGMPKRHTADKGDVCSEEAFGTPVPLIEKSIGNLFKVLCGAGGQPRAQLCMMIGKVLPCLFEVLCASSRTAWIVRTECEQLLQRHIRACEHGPSVAAVFKRFVELASQRPCQDTGTVFSIDADGHLCLSDCCNHDAAACTCHILDFIDSRVACLVNLIHGCRDDGLSAEFFLFLLQELNSVLDSDDCDTELSTSHPVIDQGSTELSRLAYKIVVPRLVAEAYETMGAAVCSAKPAHILTFAKLTLERWIRLRQAETEADGGAFEMDTLTLALGLVLAPFSDKDALRKLTEEDWAAADSLLPLLAQLELRAPPLLRQLAFAARTAVATRGRVSAADEAEEQLRQPSPHDTATARVARNADASANRPVAQQWHDGGAGTAVKAAGTAQDAACGNVLRPHAETGGATLPSKQQQQKPQQHVQPRAADSDSLQDALACLAADDEQLPLRAHALIVLRRHVERGSAEALARVQELLSACERHMNDGDSYVYLAAINCMAALADRFSESVLSVVARKFSSPPAGYSSLDRLKLGEVLVKTIRAMGDMAPKHRDVLLPAVLSGVRSDDELVRASSLAGLAEVCRLLRYSLAGHVHEVSRHGPAAAAAIASRGRRARRARGNRGFEGTRTANCQRLHRPATL